MDEPWKMHTSRSVYTLQHNSTKSIYSCIGNCEGYSELPKTAAQENQLEILLTKNTANFFSTKNAFPKYRQFCVMYFHND